MAWGVTNTGADVQDTFLVNATKAGTHYYKGGELFAFATRKERIKVKGQADVELDVRVVPGVGPVITDNELLSGTSAIEPPGALFGDSVLALRWTSIDTSLNDTTMDAFLGLNNVSSYGEFRETLRSFVAPSQNFIYADAQNNIGYQMPGKVSSLFAAPLHPCTPARAARPHALPPPPPLSASCSRSRAPCSSRSRHAHCPGRVLCVHPAIPLPSPTATTHTRTHATTAMAHSCAHGHALDMTALPRRDPPASAPIHTWHASHEHLSLAAAAARSPPRFPTRAESAKKPARAVTRAHTSAVGRA